MGSFDTVILQSSILGLQSSHVWDVDTLTFRWDQLEELRYVQLLCLLQRRTGQAFSGVHLLERDKALLLNPEERAFSYRYVRSAKPKASGVFQQLQNCRPGWGFKLRGEFKDWHLSQKPGTGAGALDS